MYVPTTHGSIRALELLASETAQLTIFFLTPRADDKTAAEYNLEGGATLHLVLALRGGDAM